MEIFRIINNYYKLYKDVIDKIEPKKYQYVDTVGWLKESAEELFTGDITNAVKIYWQEILLRTHFAAVISLIRSEKWLSGVIYGLDTKNLLVFSASFRGFLEATVDSYYSLESLPTSLALNFKSINLALNGKLNTMFFCEDIEHKLIHFQFAKKKNKKKCSDKCKLNDMEPEDWKYNWALSNTEYIKAFDLENHGIKELYSELCEIAHPAANSVNCFTKETIVSEHYSYVQTSIDTDGDMISDIAVKYSQQIEELLKIGISLYCICLKILTLFDYESIHSDYINRTIFNELMDKKSWEKILEMIDKGEKYLEENNLEK